MNLRNIKQQSIVDYLQQQGYSPQHIRGNAYWYCSPFRNEQTASFKVNTERNQWYDFATGEHGDIIDLVCILQHCSIAEAMKYLSSASNTSAVNSSTPIMMRQEEKHSTNWNVRVHVSLMVLCVIKLTKIWMSGLLLKPNSKKNSLCYRPRNVESEDSLSLGSKVCLCTTNCHLFHKDPCPKGVSITPKSWLKNSETMKRKNTDKPDGRCTTAPDGTDGTSEYPTPKIRRSSSSYTESQERRRNQTSSELDS